MAMCLSVLYIPCAKSLKEQTCNIITFTQFEEGGLLFETHNDAESSDKFDNDSIIPSLMSEKEMDAVDYGNELDERLCLPR